MGWLSGALKLGASIFGARAQDRAIRKAEKRSRQLTERQIRELVAAYEEAGRLGDIGTQRQIRALLQGYSEARGILGSIRDETAPARGVMVQAARGPEGLYPWQQRALEDLRRSMQHQLMAAGTRGMGEGGIAVAFDQLARSRERLDADNRREQLSAAEMLSRQGYDVTQKLAGLAAGQGEQISRLYGADSAGDVARASRLGEIRAGLYGDQGATDVAAALARGNLQADTFGSIAGIIAQSAADRDPARRFSRMSLGWA